MGRLSEYSGQVIMAVMVLALVALLVWLIVRFQRLDIDLRDDEPAVDRSLAKVEDSSQLAEEFEALKKPPRWSTNSGHQVFIGPPMVDENGKLKPRPPPDPEGVSAEGFTNRWLIANKLSLTRPVANADPYGKGFTVREEYDAGTNPIDLTSHPDYAIKLRIRGALSQEPFPFLFMGVSERGGETVFSIARLNRQKTYIVKRNDPVPDESHPGYRVVGYTQKSVSMPDLRMKGPDGQPIVRKVDVSELSLRKEGMEPVVLVKEQAAWMPGFIADLVFLIDRKVSFKVKENAVFTLRGGDYKVLSVQKQTDGTPKVAIQKLDSAGKPVKGKQFNLLPYGKADEPKTAPAGQRPYTHNEVLQALDVGR